MGSSSSTTSELDLADVQGLVGSGYGRLPEARFLGVRVDDGAAGRALLSRLLPQVTSMSGTHTARALNVAITHTGLAHLGLPLPALNLFSLEFAGGMATPQPERVPGRRGRTRSCGPAGQPRPPCGSPRPGQGGVSRVGPPRPPSPARPPHLHAGTRRHVRVPARDPGPGLPGRRTVGARGGAHRPGRLIPLRRREALASSAPRPLTGRPSS
jgi:hypothetical protein